MAMATVLMLFVSLLVPSIADNSFDVRQHFSTVTRYGVVKDISVNAFVASTVPDGCSPIHLNLVARHGTRSPTKKRMRELDNFASHLDVLLRDAKNEAQQGNLSLQKVPAWLWGWQSPWKGKLKGGELMSKGEDEMYHLGIRIRERFLGLFDEEYHPDIFVIKATQVPRASASAVAFGLGLFNGRGSLGPGRHRAFAVTSESRASDILLRFHDCCENYKIFMPQGKRKTSPVVFSYRCAAAYELISTSLSDIRFQNTHYKQLKVSIPVSYTSILSVKLESTCTVFSYLVQDFRKSQEPSVNKLKEPILDEVTSALVKRHELNFTRQDIASLWFLCKQEASLLDITDQACGLFNPSEVTLLEWMDDLGVFILKGYGNSLNYRMGVPLLQDVALSMEQAINAKEEHHTPGTYEKARLRFAHAETLIPFSCLLGLFLEESEFKQIQMKQPLQLPLKPPNKRNWRGSTVAPFAGNNMLVLYSCPANNSSKYFVQVLHNEIPVPLPGCDNTDFCPYEVFKERVVNPHLKHDYNIVCDTKLEQPKPEPVTSKLQQVVPLVLGEGE
ncbi:hypothetical protein HHK36_010668 [Tetracentron sinense]|uniref:Multiple inositol polyphosphate phosphatase 1 n=1 Tax=Tetracentron sinense TaxID=13715 RepID=A0A834ZAU4_TETSI|nr:hypothetical protein HHK36_010668 [Tetracentron sinense]